MRRSHRSKRKSKGKTGLRSDVITLYQGGAYHLYCYKRYDDVRIVFAPEAQMAFYGGDPDNFEYPRFDLDVCIFRVYENGQPVKVDNYLKWNSAGPADGELTLVSGSPGRTDRQQTVDELADRRDREVPTWLQMFNRREVLVSAWGQRSFENARRARHDLFGGPEQSQTLRRLCRRALRSTDMGARSKPGRRNCATPFRAIQNLNQPCLLTIGSRKRRTSWARSPYVIHTWNRRPVSVGYRGPRAFFGTLFKYARLLIRAADERAKPNGERIADFRDSAKESLELELFSGEPV